MEPGAHSHSSPVVTVVVVTYNSERLLPGFFAALEEGLSCVEATVVISDNASHDSTIDVARSLWPSVVIVRSDVNRGYAAGINAAVKAVRPSEAVLVLNDDIRLSPGSVAALLRFSRASGAGITVPRLADADGSLLRSLRRAPSIPRALGEAILGGDRSGSVPWLGEVLPDDGSYEQPTVADWASGCAWMIGIECWDEVGEWDESLFLYAEDIDYALRAGDAGYQLRLDPEVTITHLVGPSRRDARLWSMSVWNRYRVYRRRHGALASLVYRSVLVLNEGARCLAGRSIHCSGLAVLVRPSQRPIEVR